MSRERIDAFKRVITNYRLLLSDEWIAHVIRETYGDRPEPEELAGFFEAVLAGLGREAA